MKETTDGRAYSRRVARQFDSGELDAWRAQVAEDVRNTPSSLSGILGLARVCELHAIDYLRSAGLPHESNVLRYWRVINSNGKRGAWQPAGQRIPLPAEVRSLDWIVTDAGYKRDDLPDLGCRIVRACNRLRAAAERNEPVELAAAAFSLGALSQLADVYRAQHKHTSAGGGNKPLKPWEEYAARLLKRHPGASKKELWRFIPDDGVTFTIKTSAGTFEIGRNDADTELIAERMNTDGTTTRYTVSQDYFFKEYLKTLKKSFQRK